MSDAEPELVRATWSDERPRYFPSLGRTVRQGDRLEVPASLVDEYPGSWQRVYDPDAAEYVEPGAPEPAKKQPKE